MPPWPSCPAGTGAKTPCEAERAHHLCGVRGSTPRRARSSSATAATPRAWPRRTTARPGPRSSWTRAPACAGSPGCSAARRSPARSCSRTCTGTTSTGCRSSRPGDRDDARVTLLLPEQEPGEAVPREDVLARGMSPPHFPITPDGLRGDWTFGSLAPGAFKAEGFTVEAREVPHKGGRTFGYRVSDGHSAIAYIPDHCPTALGPGPDGLGRVPPRRAGPGRPASDLLIHDAFLLPDEVAAEASFGHSAADYAVALAHRAGARRRPAVPPQAGPHRRRPRRPRHPLPPRPHRHRSRPRPANRPLTPRTPHPAPPPRPALDPLPLARQRPSAPNAWGVWPPPPIDGARAPACAARAHLGRPPEPAAHRPQIVRLCVTMCRSCRRSPTTTRSACDTCCRRSIRSSRARRPWLCGMPHSTVDRYAAPGGRWQRLLPGVVPRRHRDRDAGPARAGGAAVRGARSLLTGSAAMRRHRLRPAGPDVVDAPIPWATQAAEHRVRRGYTGPGGCQYGCTSSAGSALPGPHARWRTRRAASPLRRRTPGRMRGGPAPGLQRSRSSTEELEADRQRLRPVPARPGRGRRRRSLRRRSRLQDPDPAFRPAQTGVQRAAVRRRRHLYRHR